MTGDTKPGDALADKTRDEFERNRRERELAIARLQIRAEQRSEHGEEEDTGVIHLKAEERVKGTSEPPKSTSWVAQAFAFANGFPAWGKVIVALAAIGAYVALRLAGVAP